MQFDVIIIGGGINGAGIARDAARRGLKICLVEQGDFCAATSRWCSRLVHGGLRYLEFAEFGLVRESLAERETLLRTAPHLVRPLPLLIPIRRGARRGPLTVRAGMWLYDFLSAGKSLPNHRMLDAAAAHAAVPGLVSANLEAAALYYDGQVTFPERLVLENLLDAGAHGAELRSGTRVERVLVEAGRVIGVAVRDLERNKTETVRAPLVVNATGPWVDQLLGSLAGRRPRRFIGGSKGAHIVVDRLPGLGDTACYAEAGSDGRPFFVLPWNGMTLIGTTDIAWSGDPAEVAAAPTEVDYLLREAERLFPAAGLRRESIHFAYSGVRPLPQASGKEQGAITRRHQVKHHRTIARGLYSIIGGKLTTYRSLAEEVVDRLARKVKQPLRPCDTATTPLPGAVADSAALVAELVGSSGLTPQTAERLASIYGARGLEVAALARRTPGLGNLLSPADGAIGAEIIYAFESERARSLADAIMRRTMLGLGADIGANSVEAALDVARGHLGWDDARAAAERAAWAAERAALRAPLSR